MHYFIRISVDEYACSVFNQVVDQDIFSSGDLCWKKYILTNSLRLLVELISLGLWDWEPQLHTGCEPGLLWLKLCPLC